MKPEEILYSIEHVGDDLIGAAEQTVVARKHRPWLGIAAAAVLVMAVVGGAVGLFLHNRSVNAGNAGPGSTENREQDLYSNLPLLTVGGNYKGESDCVSSEEQLRRLLSENAAWREVVKSGKLPVYVNEAIPEDSDVMTYYSQAQLAERLQRAAELCGLTITDEPVFTYCRELAMAAIPGEDEPVCRASVQTDQGTLVATGDGSISFRYNEDKVYTVPAEEDGSVEQIVRAMLGRLGFLNPEEYILTQVQIRHPYMSNFGYYSVAQKCQDPDAQFYSAQFSDLKLLTVDGKRLYGFCSTLFAAENTDKNGSLGYWTPDSLKLFASYPVISPEKAQDLLFSGQFLLNREVKDLSLDQDLSEYMELVYLTGTGNRILLPFYRFWVQHLSLDDLLDGQYEYLAVYVPAVRQEYLSDWPSEVKDPDPTEPVSESTDVQETELVTTDPTEPPDGYRPMPVQSENGSWQIAGPAGNVEALTYMGPACQDAVWADLDGDGFDDLIYRFPGPASGLFTVGICVYDLVDGWPVLLASQIYALTWGDVSLSEEAGTVYFRYTPKPYDPAQEIYVPQEEQVYSVSLENATLLLNNGEMSEDIRLWGDPEWSRYGASFAQLKQEVKKDCLLNHWLCLVWKDSIESADGARIKYYAAVTRNEISGTGFLRYEKQALGWSCTRQGIEPIDAPEDPEALIGLTIKDLVSRYGPCHFDMGSGLYIPCWFTKDCRLLRVVGAGTVIRADLVDLADLNK